MQYPNDSNNNKKTTVNELNLEIPQLNFKKDYKEANRCNEIDFSLGSPDIHQSQRYRASPYYDMLPMFTGDGDSIAKSPEKFGDGSEMNFRPISPENPFTKSPFDHNFNRFFQQKNLDMSDHSVSNIFGPQSPRHERLPINFQYDSAVMNLFEKNTKSTNIINLQSTNQIRRNDFSLNLLKIPNNSKVMGDSVKKKEATKIVFEKTVPCVQTELENLDKLFALLIKIFTRKQIEEKDLKISLNELKIMNYVLHRKYSKRLTTKDLGADVSIQLSKLSSIVGSKSHKRPEECYKFIFTRVLKYLKKSFKKNFNIKSNLDEKFYGYYFANIAQQNDMSVEEYYYPLTKKSKKKETLNAEYFAKIFQSQDFINDLVKFINEHLNEEYKTEIIQKLESLLLKWDKYFDNDSTTVLERNMDEIKTYLMKNKRCKLPWTLDEVKEAVMRVYALIDTHGDSGVVDTQERAKFFQ